MWDVAIAPIQFKVFLDVFVIKMFQKSIFPDIDTRLINYILTVAGRVAVAAGETFWTRDALPHTVTHVTPRCGLQAVRHKAGAVPHSDVQLSDTALPVLVDAGGGCNNALMHRRNRS